MDSYSPAEVTARTGFSIDTIRYYERIGLLHEVGRTAGGRRRFTEEDLRFLQLLRCLRDTDMPIAEMLRFVGLLRDGEHTAAQRLEVLREHEKRVTEQIERLHGHQEHIRMKITYYRAESEQQNVAAV
ncbi:MerR family transcriptional regulator [Amycolatopsis jiangsuensis]|uniref:DNA-binding transcriptional MerR regulator n=1 Tax=Amycolatopsis jiangsuensis TaxID=1181879 RepID=A0A840IPH6_9PSEU|nr:MerR family transcriptional regulator [Amycolatopsis jiangsuensis]MBB4683092.1 DNA-binding transcriptional MerR regulator [Amycolatopsis jiangsuensis]